MVAELQPDHVLMDINKPGNDGLEATQRLTNHNPDLKVVVLSTYEAADYEHPALEAGAVAFVSKSDFGIALELVPFDGPGRVNKLVRGPAYRWAVLHDRRIRQQDW